ncbi:MAG: PRC-barrel domain-containing protein [Bacillota bacterium]
MIRQSSLIGITVVDSGQRHMLGRVRSFEICLETNALLGFTYATNGIIRKRVFVPREKITEIDSGFVTIERPQKKVKHPKETLDLSKRLEVVDQDGNDLGFVVDFFIDEKKRQLDALEVSQGVFEDVLSGRFTVKDFSRMEYSEKIIAACKNEKQGERRVET